MFIKKHMFNNIDKNSSIFPNEYGNTHNLLGGAGGERPEIAPSRCQFSTWFIQARFPFINYIRF